jgi:hypothetical protein
MEAIMQAGFTSTELNRHEVKPLIPPRPSPTKAVGDILQRLGLDDFTALGRVVPEKGTPVSVTFEGNRAAWADPSPSSIHPHGYVVIEQVPATGGVETTATVYPSLKRAAAQFCQELLLAEGTLNYPDTFPATKHTGEQRPCQMDFNSHDRFMMVVKADTSSDELSLLLYESGPATVARRMAGAK